MSFLPFFPQDEQPDDAAYAPLRAAPQLSPRLAPPSPRSGGGGAAAAITATTGEYTTAANATLQPPSTSPLAGFSHLTEGPDVGLSAGGSALDLSAAGGVSARDEDDVESGGLALLGGGGGGGGGGAGGKGAKGKKAQQKGGGGGGGGGAADGKGKGRAVAAFDSDSD